MYTWQQRLALARAKSLCWSTTNARQARPGMDRHYWNATRALWTAAVMDEREETRGAKRACNVASHYRVRLKSV